MKIKIDFYSKEKMGIQLDISGNRPFSDERTNELFLFICFTLRQLSNLGEHPASQALSGFLIKEENIKTFLSESKIPPAKDLLTFLKIYASTRLSINKNIQEIARISDMLDTEFKHSRATIDAIDTVVISTLPLIVKHEGNGKRYFEATYPPFLFNTKGFGFLGTDINHHAFHSILGLIRFLENKNTSEASYLRYLIKSAEQCGALFAFKKISYNQSGMALEVIKDLAIEW